MWWALWYERVVENGESRLVKMRVSTGVHVRPTRLDGALTTAGELKKTAQEVADTKERESCGTLTAREAVESVARFAERRGMGRPRTKMPRLAEFAAKYGEAHGRQVSDAAMLRRHLANFVRLCPQGESVRLADVTPAMVDDYVRARLAEGVQGTTVERELTDVSAMFNRAVAERLLPVGGNPATHTKIPASAMYPQIRDAFTEDELELILKSGEGEWPDMVLVALLLGGQRLGDVATLRWEAWSEATNTIRVRTMKARRPMHVLCLPLLTEVLQRRRAHAVAGMPFVFPWAAARYGQAGGKSSKLSIDFGKLLRKLGIIGAEEEVADDESAGVARKSKKRDLAQGAEQSQRKLSRVSFHSLRKTSVSFLTACGVPWELVLLIVGISSDEVAREHYLRPTPEQLREQMQHMEALLSRLRGGGEF